MNKKIVFQVINKRLQVSEGNDEIFLSPRKSFGKVNVLIADGDQFVS